MPDDFDPKAYAAADDDDFDPEAYAADDDAPSDPPASIRLDSPEALPAMTPHELDPRERNDYLRAVQEPGAPGNRERAAEMEARNPRLVEWRAEKERAINDFLQSAGIGGARMLTLETLPKLQGFGKAIMDKLVLVNPSTMGSLADVEKASDRGAKRLTEEYDELEARSPAGSIAGRVAGAVAPAAAITPLGGLAKGIGAGAELAPGMAKILQMLGVAGDASLMAGITGYNRSTAPSAEGKAYEGLADASLAAPMAAAAFAGPEVISSGARLLQKGAGKALRLPKEARDAAALKLGKAEMRASSAARPGLEDELIEQEALERLGKAGARAARAGRSKVDPEVLRKPLSSMTGEESEQVVDAVGEALAAKFAAKDGIKPDRAAAAALIRQVAEDAPGASGDEVIRLVVRHDPANVSRRVMTAYEAYEPVLRSQGVKADPRWMETYQRAAGLRGDFEAGKLNRVFAGADDAQPGAVGVAGQRPSVGAVTDDVVDEQQMMRAAAGGGETGNLRVGVKEGGATPKNPESFNDGMTTIHDTKRVVDPRRAKHAAMPPRDDVPYDTDMWTPEEWRDFLFNIPENKARFEKNLAEVPRHVPNPGDPRGDELEEALRRLENFQDWRGLRGEGTKLLPLEGSGSPGAAAAAAQPPAPAPAAVQAPAAAPAQAPQAQKIQPWNTDREALRRGQSILPLGKTADRMDRLGRVLEGSAAQANTPERAAASLAANPSLLLKMAQQPGQLGGFARFALEGLESGGKVGLKARMFVLTMQPGFRELFAEDTDERGPSASTSTAP